MVHILGNTYEFDVRRQVTYLGDYIPPVLEYVQNGAPVPKELLPPTLDMTFPPDIVPETLTPFDAPPVMPDFFFWCHVLVASGRFRTVLETHVPAYYEYVPMRLNCEPVENVADEYWYANLLVKGQYVDWENSRIVPPRRWPDGRVTAQWERPPGRPGLGMRFKPIPLHHMWHEVDFQSEGILYGVDMYKTLVSDALWAVFDATFPGQLPERRRFND